jgi:hypothetical protein
LQDTTSPCAEIPSPSSAATVFAPLSLLIFVKQVVRNHRRLLAHSMMLTTMIPQQDLKLNTMQMVGGRI